MLLRRPSLNGSSMRFQVLLSALALLSTASATSSSKRGLVYVPNAKTPEDNTIWDSSSSDLTWYYNYQVSPSPAFANNPNFEFVPMLWGAPTDLTDMIFLNTVQEQMKKGTNISHVLAFNEPDGQSSTGGSAIPAVLAAKTWIREIEPLKKLGVKLGAPAVTGAPNGFNWLQNFFAACDGGCSADFIPVHWYGNFEGLASHIGQVRGTYPNMTVWVTEYANPGVSLAESQSFYNTSAEYFDRIECVLPIDGVALHLPNALLSYIERYSYFGAFRSSVSNVGPNAAMLDQNGKLTDIGSWYLGGSATGVVPQASAGSRTVAGSALLAIFAMFWFLLQTWISGA